MCSFQLEQQGGFHLWEGCVCQDKVHYIRKGDVESLTLCDGAGSLDGALEAARTFSQGVNEWITEHFSTTLRGKSEEAVKRLVIAEIDRLLTRLTAGAQIARDLYGCTLLTACRNMITGEALVLHLGDGVILGWTPEEGCRCLTQPEQGEALRATWLVNSSPAMLMEHLRVLRLRPGRSVSAFLLMSDGGEGPLYMPTSQGVTLNPVMAKLAEEFLLRPSSFATAMPDFVQAQVRPADDFSLGVMGDAPASLLPIRASRRIVREYTQYLCARRSGLSPLQAARRAGWRKRDIPRKRKRLEAMRIEEV